ncbi:Uncharacterized protein BP5553_03425 [Venustampulla echinocandica]|uniref:Transcription initiation factor TFIID subunit 8 n=1 Tax=Venustampulla echinocandica TaxID=2656787 RepID=A0A370TU79_9HELO|nr:Uncharacterized protein BP5553_03425 [Venustampulla echinocandica]RDL39085.1 Uncharacterized protein BP5553_03425 [Venustampulla echinocandica]
MIPLSPVSRKRSTPSPSDDDTTMDEPLSKKRCVEATLPRTPPPEEPLNIHVDRTLFFDDDPKQLLSRSVAIALQHVGFDGATPEALEAFCGEVEEYAAHLLSKVATHMINSRRIHPMPFDFEYALSRFDLPLLSLEPHLKNPVDSSKLHIQLEADPPEAGSTVSIDALFANELSGAPEKKAKIYIPKRFPSFPSKHTYRWTEKESSRETDPRKIREEASKSARQGEEALRRFVNVSKAGKEKNVKKAASKDPKSKERHELWEKTMEDFMAGKRKSGLEKPNENDDRSMIVNSDRVYYRKGALAKRKPPAEIS